MSQQPRKHADRDEENDFHIIPYAAIDLIHSAMRCFIGVDEQLRQVRSFSIKSRQYFLTSCCSVGYSFTHCSTRACTCLDSSRLIGRPPPILTSKLGVEMLETREVPAVWDPLNGSKDSTVAENWLATTSVSTRFSPGVYSPSTSEDLIFGATIDAYQTHNPLYGQPGQGMWIIVPERYVTADCDLKQLGSSGGNPYGPPPPPTSPPAVANYYGVRLLEPYTGTVKLLQSANITQLDIANGKLNQADPLTMNPAVPLQASAGKITVDQRMGWTGGSINVGGMAGFLDISAGASARVEPAGGGTVYTGNTISLIGSQQTQTYSTLTHLSGTIEIGLDQRVDVGVYSKYIMTRSSVLLSPQAPPGLPPAVPTPAKLLFVGVTMVGQNAKMNVRGSLEVKRATEGTDLQLGETIEGWIVNRGSVSLDPYTALVTAGKGSDTVAYKQDGSISEPQTILGEGSQLASTTNDIVFAGGELLVTNDEYNKNSKIIVPDLKSVKLIDSTQVKISAFSATTEVGTLNIVGNLFWGNAVFHSYFELSNNTAIADSIIVTKKVTFADKPVVKVYWSDTRLVGIGVKWMYMHAEEGTTNAQGTMPSLEIGGLWSNGTNSNNYTFKKHVNNDGTIYEIERLS